MAGIMSERGTSIAVANNINHVWGMARRVHETLAPLSPLPDEIRLVQDFLKTEISPEFELIPMLACGVGVHHAGLSDEVRALMEWLAEESRLRVLCATTTIAQGINFPVSSVFLATNKYPYGREMSPREFWNLAGRAGRMNHDSIGVVGLARGNEPEKIVDYVSRATGDLVSRLVHMLDALDRTGRLSDLEAVLQGEQWEDFRCYVAHLWREKQNLDDVLADTEQLLRNTFGYGVLRASERGKAKADRLLEATRNYARRLSEHPDRAGLADMTGFSPEGIGTALAGMNDLPRKLTAADWMPESLFGRGSGMADLYGIMLRIPQLKSALQDIGGQGVERRRLGDLTQAWLQGNSIHDIAREFFEGDSTRQITDACKAIYRNLANTGTWGLAALSKLPNSGIDFDEISETDRRRINLLPAMVYHGVRTEEAVLMRMNAAPRSVAERLGNAYAKHTGKTGGESSVGEVREFLKGMEPKDWDRVRPDRSTLSGEGYKSVWEILSGER